MPLTSLFFWDCGGRSRPACLLGREPAGRDSRKSLNKYIQNLTSKYRSEASQAAASISGSLQSDGELCLAIRAGASHGRSSVRTV